MKVKNVLCRKRTNIALKMTFTGLFAVAAALYFLGATPAYAQEGPPLNPKDAPGGLPQCQAELAACEALPSAVFPGDGVDGPALDYVDNLDGTFTDLNTGLMWEMKVALPDTPSPGSCPTATDLHWVKSKCTWDEYTVAWINAINAEALGGFTDWRTANVRELQSIVDYSLPDETGFSPASSVPGETENSRYWSSTVVADDPAMADSWVVGFGFGVVGFMSNGDFGPGPTTNRNNVRAVRGGR